VGFIEVEVSYCNSKKRPAFEAVGVVAHLVVVNESKTKAAYDNFCDRGVDEYERKADRTWDRRVVFPAPDSPLLAG